MDKLLKILITVLVILVAIAIVIRVGEGNNGTGSELTPQLGDQTTAQPSETAASTETTAPTETEPPETEPPVVLTFGEDFTLESKDYFVYHCGEERTLAVAGEMDDMIYPASITKLFTAHVALLYLDPEEVVVTGPETDLVAYDSSRAYIVSGQRLTVEQLVEGMLLPSGNDAAYALAGAAARAQSGNAQLKGQEAVDYFVDLMNQEAQNQGMTGTRFNNPDGYHDFEHYTTCTDLVTVARLALGNDVIARYAGTYTDKVTYVSGEIATWSNTNALIDPEAQYYCPDAVGLKTGSTSYAGFCLLSAFELEGEYIIIGSFECIRPEDRFIDTLKLYDLVLEAYGCAPEEEIVE